jgi:hypothetical protein
MERAGVLDKAMSDLSTRKTQTGTVAISQAASTEVIRTYASAAVALATPYFDTDYQIVFEVLSATPNADFVGEVRAESKSINGFVIVITGSATAVAVKWTTINLQAK